jgi:hypothetical protein
MTTNYVNYVFDLPDMYCLDEIADIIEPCPAPDVMNGDDQCTCTRGLAGETWPCRDTRVAWLARRINPDAESARILADRKGDI